MSFRTRLSALLGTARGDVPVLISDDHSVTWDDLRTSTRALDERLTPLGAGPGTRVGLALANRTGTIAALLALLATERLPVLLDPMHPTAGMHDGEGRPRAALVITTTGMPHPGARTITVDHDGRPLADPAPDLSGPVAEVAAPNTALELVTSGTTGPPRPVAITTEQLDATMGPTPETSPEPGRAPSLLAAPASHVSGLWTVLGAVHAARALVLLPRFAAEPWARAVHHHRVRVAFLVPAALHAVLDADIDPALLDPLELVTTGASPCPPELAARFQDRFGVRVLPTYGATEFAGAVAGWSRALHERWWPDKAGSCGRALPGVALRTTAPDGTVLPPGVPGRLEVRGARTGSAPTRWVRTADLASLDADGFLVIHGRADGAVLRGGFTVLPEDVARVLERHPSVREAAVTGLPDERLGEVPVAAVLAEPAGPPPDPSELQAHCRARLSPVEVPVRIVVLDSLPRTASAKVDHRALRADLTNLAD
ncbi:class I adenylate-forming enzyme family protein [Saccharopolyspora sp. CA-218241]|uniref:class I adenylate-forming enzyme family protein n=1 Tax=Saccharopolyspora sp. CA-218241 TaxID=3240027 RepID=UPI003D994086